MRIPVEQIPENGWTRTLDIPLASLKRVVETHGPQTGSLRARVVLKNHRGNIDVRGEFSAELSLSCGVCLDEGTVKVAAPLELMVAPQAEWAAGHTDSFHEEVKLSPHDLDVSFYEGEELDLNQLLEDELLIAAPDRLSEEDAAGTCSYCGLDVDTVLRQRQPAAQAEDAAFHPFRDLAQRMNEDDPEKPAGVKKKDRKRKA
jgi:uncharacterized metal-binding protein YceD (DUF177 family)